MARFLWLDDGFLYTSHAIYASINHNNSNICGRQAGSTGGGGSGAGGGVGEAAAGVGGSAGGVAAAAAAAAALSDPGRISKTIRMREQEVRSFNDF
jgi:hypothetical protein